MVWITCKACHGADDLRDGCIRCGGRGTENVPLLSVTLKEPPVPLWALVAIDLQGWPALINCSPAKWWDRMLMGDGFVDVFDARLPERPGIYSWHGHYRPNPSAGVVMPNGELDDHPGEWVGSWTQEEVKGYPDGEPWSKLATESDTP